MRRSKFSLSHYKLATMDMGYLVPIACIDALPGDTFQHSTSMLVRVSPLLAPVMHPVVVRVHHWFVPLRLVWEDFEDFITGGPDGVSLPVHPHFASGSVVAKGELADYLGVPPGLDYADHFINALPFRAYGLIWNEYYRDQDLVDPVVISTASGADTTTSRILKRAAWTKDYFTSARPFEQKGEAVTIPLTGDAPVVPSTDPDPLERFVRMKPYLKPAEDLFMGTLDTHLFLGGTAAPSTVPVEFDRSGLQADLSAVSGVTINDLREALAIQRYREARSNFGSRYVEYLRYLGVRPSDARLQLPEYLGGGRQTIQFSEVLQTAEGTDPVGEMRGHGMAAMRTNRYRRFIEEHGFVMTCASIIPKPMYSQNISRSMLRAIKEDYFQKELQFIGDQPISNREVYFENANPGDIWGYQHRYDEYRSHPSTIAGDFRDTLNYWHLAREFTGDSVPLNSTFINCTPTERIFADASGRSVYLTAKHSIQARRMLVKHPSPRTF